MNIDVRWLDEDQTAVLTVYQYGWTWDDFDTATDSAFALIRTVSHPVDIISDTSAAPTPPNPLALGHFQRALAALPENLGVVIVISASRFMEQTGTMFTRIFAARANRTHFVRSMDEAQQKLNEVRAARSPRDA